MTLLPGQYFDQETGLHYNWHRYYAPELGRYLQPDPLGLWGGSTNLYSYVENNPLGYGDPSGLSTVRIHTGAGTTTLVDPTIREFRGAINSLAPVSMTGLEIVGHGSSHGLVIEPGASGDGLVFDPAILDTVRMTDNGDSFADLIRGKLAPGASVDLNGCNTAREKGPFGSKPNLAQQLSTELPGTSVTGNRGFGFGNELSWPFNRDHYFRLGTENHILRIPRTYLGGR